MLDLAHAISPTTSVLAWAGAGVVTVLVISTSEMKKAEVAAASLLVKVFWWVMVFSFLRFGSAGCSADATMIAGGVPVSKNHANPCFLQNERKLSPG
jgi:hypothetical protein